MIPLRNFLWLIALLLVSVNFLVGCETIKGVFNGARRGVKRDIQDVTEAAKGETDNPQGLGVAVDAVRKTDQWIKDNMW